MKPESNIWVFLGDGGNFPSAAFNDFKSIEKWVSDNKLTGMISALPMNQGFFDWAVENDAISMKEEKIALKKKDSRFIATFTTASIDHWHYENGVQSGT